jgi:hypothetical protein
MVWWIGVVIKLMMNEEEVERESGPFLIFYFGWN